MGACFRSRSSSPDGSSSGRSLCPSQCAPVPALWSLPAPASRRCNIPCSPKSTAWLLHFFALCVVASLGDTFYWSTYHAYFAALGNHDTAGPRSACLRRLRPWLASRAPWQQVGPCRVRASRRVRLERRSDAVGGVAVVDAGRHRPASCSRRVPGGNSGPEAVPGGWLDWRGLSFRLANRAVSFAGRKLCRLWRGARPCRTGWRRRGPCARPAYRCRTWAEHSVLRNRRARLDDGLACSGARPCCPCGYRQCARALVVCLYIPTVMAAVHNQAKRSACTLRFHVATEGAWDVGCGSGCLVAALLSALGVLSVAILLSLLGALALFVLLRRYYASHPRDDGRCARSARAERHRQSGRER